MLLRKEKKYFNFSQVTPRLTHLTVLLNKTRCRNIIFKLFWNVKQRLLEEIILKFISDNSTGSVSFLKIWRLQDIIFLILIIFFFFFKCGPPIVGSHLFLITIYDLYFLFQYYNITILSWMSVPSLRTLVWGAYLWHSLR